MFKDLIILAAQQIHGPIIEMRSPFYECSIYFKRGVATKGFLKVKTNCHFGPDFSKKYDTGNVSTLIALFLATKVLSTLNMSKQSLLDW